jgi:hypothetical protein
VRRRLRESSVIALTVLLVLTGAALSYSLTLPGGTRHANAGVALIARNVPRVTGYQMNGCRVAPKVETCHIRFSIRALSGGTIICRRLVRVRSITAPGRMKRPTVLVSSFPGHIACIRELPRRTRGG